MKFPTSHIEEVQKRIDRASEIFATLDEETIFWIKWQHSCTVASKERNETADYKAPKESLKIK